MIDLFFDKQIRKYFSLACVYQKHETIFLENDKCDQIGLIIEGNVQMIHYHINGHHSVLAELKYGDVFGDFLVHSMTPFYLGDLVALTTVKIVYMNRKNLDYLLKSSDKFRSRFIDQISQKAINLNRQNKVLQQKTLEDKVLMWLSYKTKEGKTRVKITSKEALALYFSVERPSLSRTLKHLKDHGWIDYNRKEIIVLKKIDI